MIFALPMSGTVTNVSIKIGPNRQLNTVVMSKDDAAKLTQVNCTILDKHQTNTKKQNDKVDMI